MKMGHGDLFISEQILSRMWKILGNQLRLSEITCLYQHQGIGVTKDTLLHKLKHFLKFIAENASVINWHVICTYENESYNYKSIILTVELLTHWGRVTHFCVGNLTIIGSDNGFPPGRRQAIIWTNARILLIGHLGTNFILIRPQCVNWLGCGFHFECVTFTHVVVVTFFIFTSIPISCNKPFSYTTDRDYRRE